MAASPIPATGVGWNTAIPDVDQPHGNDYNEHHETKMAVAIRCNKEHVAFATASAGGEHKPGSAVSYIGDMSTSAKADTMPLRRPDAAAPWQTGGTALTAADIGRCAYDTDATYGGVYYILTAVGPVTWEELGVALKQAQTIAGVKTFESLPKVIANATDFGDPGENPDDSGNRTPTDDKELTPKKYVDDKITVITGYARYTEKYANNTAGTSFSTTTWTKIVLTDEEQTSITGSSLATGVITLPAGTYKCRYFVNANIVGTGNLQTRLRKTDGTAATVVVGSRVYVDATYGVSQADDKFTIAEESTLELQIYSGQSGNTGSAWDSSGGENQIYCGAAFERVS